MNKTIESDGNHLSQERAFCSKAPKRLEFLHKALESNELYVILLATSFGKKILRILKMICSYLTLSTINTISRTPVLFMMSARSPEFPNNSILLWVQPALQRSGSEICRTEIYWSQVVKSTSVHFKSYLREQTIIYSHLVDMRIISRPFRRADVHARRRTV